MKGMTNHTTLILVFLILVSIAKSQSQVFVQCPSIEQYQNCTGCTPNKINPNKPICYCFNASFSVGGRCFIPYYPCSQSLIEPIISNNNTGNSLWDRVISSFLEIKVKQAIVKSNLTVNNPQPEFMNNMNFTNMTFDMKRGWTQGYYVYQVYKTLNLNSSLTQSDLIIKAINFVSDSLIGKSTMQKWELITKFYNQTFRFNLTSDQFTLGIFRPIIKLLLPCSGCYPMYGIILNGQNSVCSKCSPNCQSCTDQTSKCLNCSQRFFLNNGKCQLCPFPNCVSCNQSECFKCQDGYSVVNKTCIECSEQCYFCTDSTPNICSQCMTIFNSQDPNLYGKCYKCQQDQCKICSPTNNKNCYQCFYGYYVNSEYKCSLCPENCLSCKGSVCLLCYLGYGIINGTCTQCKLKGCNRCNNNMNNCLSCYQPYYSMQSGVCILNQNIYNNQVYFEVIKCRSNCDICYNNNTQLCFKCHQRYYLEQKRCKKCIPGCLQCLDSISCFNCVSGYALMENKTCQLCPEDCRKCNSYNLSQCLDCRVGYDVDSFGKCIKLKNQLCLAYADDNSKCIACLPGFALTSYGLCISCQVGCNQTCNPNNISQCTVSRFQMSNDIQFRYLFIDEGCSAEVNGHCVIPQQGFFLKQLNGTVKAISCLYPCIYCSQKMCINCDSGYRLSSGKCILDLNCNQSCEVCPSGSQRNPLTNQCKLCLVTNCQTCLNGACLNCFEGYYLENGICKPCPTKCRTCYDSRNCRTCQSGFLWPKQFRTQSYDCIKCNQNCKTCKLSPILCTSCEQGKLLMNFQCVKRYHVNYQYILDYNYSLFLSRKKSQDFISSLQKLTLVNYTDILISSLKQGSVIITGAVNQEDYSTAQKTIKMLKKSKLPNFEVKGSAFSLMNYTETIQSTSEDEGKCKQAQVDKQKKSIEPGIIGLIVCLIVLAIFVFVGIQSYCKKKERQVKTNDPQVNSNHKRFDVQLESGKEINKRQL